MDNKPITLAREKLRSFEEDFFHTRIISRVIYTRQGPKIRFRMQRPMVLANAFASNVLGNFFKFIQTEKPKPCRLFTPMQEYQI